MGLHGYYRDHKIIYCIHNGNSYLHWYIYWFLLTFYTSVVKMYVESVCFTDICVSAVLQALAGSLWPTRRSSRSMRSRPVSVRSTWRSTPTTSTSPGPRGPASSTGKSSASGSTSRWCAHGGRRWGSSSVWGKRETLHLIYWDKLFRLTGSVLKGTLHSKIQLCQMFSNLKMVFCWHKSMSQVICCVDSALCHNLKWKKISTMWFPKQRDIVQSFEYSCKNITDGVVCEFILTLDLFWSQKTVWSVISL